MRLVALFLLIAGVTLTTPSMHAAPETIVSACSSLDRPNIDCGCVANRVAAYNRISPTPSARRFIEQGYLSALGQPNTFQDVAAEVYADPISAIAVEEAYEILGGRPQNASEYEAGCVIKDAAPAQMTLVRSTEAAANYVNTCTRSTGDRKGCTCLASRIQSRVTAPEFEAYFRSFSQYDSNSVSTEATKQVRANSMGISVQQYAALEQSARSKISPFQEADMAYCDALMWADNVDGQTEAERTNAGFEPGAVAILGEQPVQSSVSDTSSKDTLTQARDIVATSCSADGNSAQFCACYMNEFETRVVQPSASPDVVLAWALTGTSGSGLIGSDRIRLMQSVPQSDFQTAGMMMIETMDMGETCPRGPAPQAASLKGTPRERMMQICVAENEDESLCNCMINSMEAQFPPDDFELLVDIREAEFNGSDDPLATVAEQRGLSRDEAETAIMNNPAVIGGAMAMGASAMQCMGGMPNMSNIPGMPGIPQQ